MAKTRGKEVLPFANMSRGINSVLDLTPCTGLVISAHYCKEGSWLVRGFRSERSLVRSSVTLIVCFDFPLIRVALTLKTRKTEH